MTVIKDSVHNHINVKGVARALLDTPAMQRLRRISQLGTVQFVYPSANHSRFEHSLGVYHLVTKAIDTLDIQGIQMKRLQAAALLHDIGHGPYSHNIELVTHRYTGKYHDDVDEIIHTESISDTLREYGLDPTHIANLITGDETYGQLIAGELDVDRMDYVVRDAHHTGVPYGTIDHERLINGLTFADGELVLGAGNVQTAESLLVARALMNPVVYQHHVARIAKAMLRQAAERLLKETDISATELRRMDDYELFVTLRKVSETKRLAKRLDERRLFKRAMWAEFSAVPPRVREMSYEELREAEAEIATQLETDPTSVIIDVPPTPTMTESTSRVIVSGEIRQLSDESPLVSALRTAQKQQWRMGVYVPAKMAAEAGAYATNLLGIEEDGSFITEYETPLTTLDDFTT